MVEGKFRESHCETECNGVQFWDYSHGCCFGEKLKVLEALVEIMSI